MLQRLLIVASVVLVVAGLVTPQTSFAAVALSNIACETTSTSGTGTVDLSGTPVSGGYVTIAASGVPTGSTVPYRITNGAGAGRKVEVGWGVFTDGSPDTLTRVSTITTDDQTPAITPLTLSGTSEVCVGPIAEMFTAGTLGVSFLNVDVAGTTVPTNGIYEPSANILGFAVNSAAEAQMSGTAFLPASNDGLALGTTSVGWADLFLATGATINMNNGDLVATLSTGSVNLDGSSTATTLSLDGGTGAGGGIYLYEQDSNGANSILFRGAGSLASDRTCTFVDAVGPIPPTCINQPGVHFWYAAASCPTGSLTEDGSPVSRTTYAALFAVIGTTWGAGDGSTTFNLPNLDSQPNSYIRYGDGTTLTVGTVQADQILNHTHDVNRRDTDTTTQSGTGSRPVNATVSATTTNPNSGGGAENRPNSVVMKGCIWY